MKKFNYIDKKERCANNGKNVWIEENCLCIRHNKEMGFIYEIPLRRMQTAEQVLDWIHQVCVAKDWGREMAVEILDAIFYDVIPSEMWSGKA